MQHDDLVYVKHMIDLAEKAVGKLAAVDRAGYDADENLRLAVTHFVQNFGEAARKTSLPFQQSHPELPWREVIGMRHKVVHDYLEVDFDIVWKVVKQKLPPLLEILKKIAS